MYFLLVFALRSSDPRFADPDVTTLAQLTVKATAMSWLIDGILQAGGQVDVSQVLRKQFARRLPRLAGLSGVALPSRRLDRVKRPRQLQEGPDRRRVVRRLARFGVRVGEEEAGPALKLVGLFCRQPPEVRQRGVGPSHPVRLPPLEGDEEVDPGGSVRLAFVQDGPSERQKVPHVCRHTVPVPPLLLRPRSGGVAGADAAPAPVKGRGPVGTAADEEEESHGQEGRGGTTQGVPPPPTAFGTFGGDITKEETVAFVCLSGRGKGGRARVCRLTAVPAMVRSLWMTRRGRGKSKRRIGQQKTDNGKE